MHVHITIFSKHIYHFHENLTPIKEETVSRKTTERIRITCRAAFASRIAALGFFILIYTAAVEAYRVKRTKFKL